MDFLLLPMSRGRGTKKKLTLHQKEKYICIKKRFASKEISLHQEKYVQKGGKGMKDGRNEGRKKGSREGRNEGKKEWMKEGTKEARKKDALSVSNSTSIWYSKFLEGRKEGRVSKVASSPVTVDF